MARMRVASATERRSGDTSHDAARYERACLSFFERELAQPTFLRSWVAERGGEVVGGASLTVLPTLPRFGRAFSGVDGRVRDVYVAPAHRRQGVARALMAAVMTEAERLRVDRLTLGASSMGRPLYHQLGFELKTDEMHYDPS
jgi:GNAT superfamily N-acetyltransferase